MTHEAIVAAMRAREDERIALDRALISVMEETGEGFSAALPVAIERVYGRPFAELRPEQKRLVERVQQRVKRPAHN